MLDQRSYLGFRRALQDLDEENNFEVLALEKNTGPAAAILSSSISNLGNIIQLENDIIRGKRHLKGE